MLILTGPSDSSSGARRKRELGRVYRLPLVSVSLPISPISSQTPKNSDLAVPLYRLKLLLHPKRLLLLLHRRYRRPAQDVRQRRDGLERVLEFVERDVGEVFNR